METLPQNKYKQMILKYYKKFLQDFYWNLNKNEKNRDLTMILYNMCIDWLSTLKNGYTIKCKQIELCTFKFTLQQQVGAGTINLDSWAWFPL